MKKYQSHKVVEAAPILTASLGPDGSGVVGINDGKGLLATIAVPAGFVRPDAETPLQEGDYLVRYQPDGYLSWSPKAVFEAGYTEVKNEPETWQARVQKEATDLNAKITLLRAYLLSGPAIKAQALSLLQAQYKAMGDYADILDARLRHEGLIDTETPPTVRDAG